MNYWFARNFDNVHINPSYFRQLPIYPADTTAQAQFVVLVDEILAKHTALNKLREQGYTIAQRRDGIRLIDVPFDVLLNELRQVDRNFPTLTLYDAQSVDMLSIPGRCDPQTPISSNVYMPERYPTTLVLRHNKLWLEVPDENVRRYLHSYLKRPQWQGKTWDEIKNIALRTFFAAEARKKDSVVMLLDEIKRIDTAIDERVLDLYGITNPSDRQRVLGSAPVEEEATATGEEETSSQENDA